MGILVSVALCTRNGADFIEQQLLSILKQTRRPDEIVVSDDASTDATLAIVTRVTASHPSVRVIVLANPLALGISANFESAIRATSGDLVVLSDQDDVWRSHRLDRIVSEFESRPDLDLVFTNAYLVNSSGGDLGHSLFDALEISEDALAEVHAGRAFPLLLKRNLVTGATVAFRRSLLEPALPIPAPWLHDEWLAIIASVVGRVDAIEDRTIDYRQHGSNEIGVRRATIAVKVRRVFEPRGDRNQQLSQRFSALVHRMESLGSLPQPEDLQHARTKATMERDRARLPNARLRRLSSVLKYGRRGWYAAYSSQGRLDMVRDLLQSH
jgi:glycosyltransferase involved in cell wall biosynthesis